MRRLTHTHAHTRVQNMSNKPCSCFQMFTVDATFKVELEFTLSVAEVTERESEIIRCL